MVMVFTKKASKLLAFLAPALSLLLYSCGKSAKQGLPAHNYRLPPDQYVEAWCRPGISDPATEGMQARVEAPLTAPSSRSLLVSSDKGEVTTTHSDDTYQSATRTQSVDVITYQSTSMKLIIDLRKAEPNHKFGGVFTFNGADYQVLCRVLPPGDEMQ